VKKSIKEYKKNNPFELTFGLKPSNYISRLKQSDEIISNFKSRTGNNLLLITGVRGTGKTVMLSHISKQFENDQVSSDTFFYIYK